jgi:hypothetical protein
MPTPANAPPPRDRHELEAELESALVRELFAAFRHLNASYFKGALHPPTLLLGNSRSHLGRWSAESRTLEISRPLVLEQSWGSVVEVLKHEMAHQYVHEVLGELSESPHGPAFRAVCKRLGIDAGARGVPLAEKPSAEHERIVERIARLLALAESPNLHEAEAAMAAAQRLMLKYNLDGNAAGARRDYGFRHLGRPTGRVSEAARMLAMILGKYFFVEVIWVPVYRPSEGKRGSVLEICGSSANLDSADYVHGYLTETAERLWRDHQRQAGIRGDRDRQRYTAGVMAGFAEKLARQSNHHKSEGLIWIRDGDLTGYFRARHPYVRNVRHTGGTRNEAYSEGRAAGRRIVLHRAVRDSAASRGLALPAARPSKSTS